MNVEGKKCAAIYLFALKYYNITNDLHMDLSPATSIIVNWALLDGLNVFYSFVSSLVPLTRALSGSRKNDTTRVFGALILWRYCLFHSTCIGSLCSKTLYKDNRCWPEANGIVVIEWDSSHALQWLCGLLYDFGASALQWQKVEIAHTSKYRIHVKDEYTIHIVYFSQVHFFGRSSSSGQTEKWMRFNLYLPILPFHWSLCSFTRWRMATKKKVKRRIGLTFGKFNHRMNNAKVELLVES